MWRETFSKLGILFTPCGLGTKVCCVLVFVFVIELKTYLHSNAHPFETEGGLAFDAYSSETNHKFKVFYIITSFFSDILNTGGEEGRGSRATSSKVLP